MKVIPYISLSSQMEMRMVHTNRHESLAAARAAKMARPPRQPQRTAAGLLRLSCALSLLHIEQDSII